MTIQYGEISVESILFSPIATSMAVPGETPSVTQGSLEVYQESAGLYLIERCHYIHNHRKFSSLQKQNDLTVFKRNSALRILTSQESAREMLPAAFQSLRYVCAGYYFERLLTFSRLPRRMVLPGHVSLLVLLSPPELNYCLTFGCLEAG